MKRVLVAIGVLAALGARPGWAQSADECVPSTLNIAEAKYPCLYSDHRALFRVVAPDAQKVRVRIGPGFDMTQGPRRHLERHDHAARRRLPLLLAADRRRRGRGSVDAHLLRIRLAEQRDRSAGTGRRVLRAPGCAPRPRQPAVVPLESHRQVAARLCLHAARLRQRRQKELSRAVSAARVGRRRNRLVPAGTRRRHPRQPDRGEEGDADDHRDGQPERGETRRERGDVRGAGPGTAAVRRAARAAVTRHPSGGLAAAAPDPARRAAAPAVRSAVPPTPR